MEVSAISGVTSSYGINGYGLPTAQDKQRRKYWESLKEKQKRKQNEQK
jgi:hypothetical protein